MPKKSNSSIFDTIQTIAIVFILSFLVRQYLVQPFIVDGNSMEPNFHNREYLLVDKLSYRFREIKRGEVIVFRPPNDSSSNYIKRVIGLPGETVEINQRKILINNRLLGETYLQTGEETLVEETPYGDLKKTLGKNEYFVLGDNRQHSRDSREIGPIPQKNIVGRAWLIIFPLNFAGATPQPVYNLSS